MGSLGTVPTAVSKGAQQAGTFLLAHMLFCNVDFTECMTSSHGGATTWGRMQKGVSFCLCCIGCLVFALVKKRPIDKRAAGATAPQEPILDPPLPPPAHPLPPGNGLSWTDIGHGHSTGHSNGHAERRSPRLVSIVSPTEAEPTGTAPPSSTSSSPS